ncbi:MAG: aldo/keto reductase [SAR202 cluster bacterium]|nr:aldo/keto reductase [SAR202 cluster bacterium]
MLYRTLGRTGLNVSLLSLGSGGAKLLGQTDGLTQDQQTAIVRAALDLGINLIDTSHNYGDSETILGKALKGINRNAYMLGTKWHAEVDGKVADDPQALVRSVEQSLTKLCTDHIDIMFFHGPMANQVQKIVERFYPMMERLRDEGKIRFIGLSTRYQADPRHAAAEVALKTNPQLWDVIMLKFGILNQHAAKEILPLAIKHHIGIMNMAAVRVKLPDPQLLEELIADWKKAGYIPHDSLPTHNPLGWLVHDDVTSVISAAYKFAAGHPAIATIITGTSNITHLRENAANLQTPTLPQADSDRIKKLFGEIVEYA